MPNHNCNPKAISTHGQCITCGLQLYISMKVNKPIGYRHKGSNNE